MLDDGVRRDNELHNVGDLLERADRESDEEGAPDESMIYLSSA